MLDDLQELSRSYEAENRRAVQRGHQGSSVERLSNLENPNGISDIPYENSATHQEAIRNRGPEDMYEQVGYPRGPTYTMAGGQPSYLASTRAEYPPSQPGGYAGSIYPPGPNYVQGSGYANQTAYPGSVRPGVPDPYNISYEPYPDESQRPMYPGGTRREVRMDNRPEPRDPRLEPRADPRAYAIPDPRIDSRNPRDPRDESRMMPSYSYPVNSPGEPMRGYDDYVNAPPIQGGRGGGPYASSRIVQSGYDSRESPQMRDAYRHEPIREERRRPR